MQVKPEPTRYAFKTRVHIPRDRNIPTIEGQKTAALELLKKTVFKREISNFNLLSDTPIITTPGEETVLIDFEVWFETREDGDYDRLARLFSIYYYSKIPDEWKPVSPGMPYPNN